MKLLIILVSVLSSFFAYGLEKHPLLECLGNEELILHRNHVTGPNYKLNQILIGELAAASDIKMKNKFVEQVCKTKDFSPSVSLLRMLLIKDMEIYDLPNEMYARALQKGTIESFLNRIPHLFFQYLSSLQALTIDPDCLNRHVVNLDYFIKRFRYLEGDYSSSFLLAEKKKIKEIFESLKGLDRINQKCKNEQKKIQEQKSKKIGSIPDESQDSGETVEIVKPESKRDHIEMTPAPSFQKDPKDPKGSKDPKDPKDPKADHPKFKAGPPPSFQTSPPRGKNGGPPKDYNPGPPKGFKAGPDPGKKDGPQKGMDEKSHPGINDDAHSQMKDEPPPSLDDRPSPGMDDGSPPGMNEPDQSGSQDSYNPSDVKAPTGSGNMEPPKQ